MECVPRRMDGENTAHWFGSSSTAAAALRKEPDSLSDWCGVCQMCVWSPAFGSRSAAVDGCGPQRCSGGCRFRLLGRRRCNRHQSPRRSWTHVSLNAQQASSHQSPGAPSMFLFLVSGLSEPPPPPSPPGPPHQTGRVTQRLFEWIQVANRKPPDLRRNEQLGSDGAGERRRNAATADL